MRGTTLILYNVVHVLSCARPSPSLFFHVIFFFLLKKCTCGGEGLGMMLKYYTGVMDNNIPVFNHVHTALWLRPGVV